MAYRRLKFKNALREALGGALIAFYKVECANANDLTEMAEHWMTEVRRLLESMTLQVYLHPIQGFKDRRKALAEVLADLKRLDRHLRREAIKAVATEHGVGALTSPIPSKADQRFHALLEDHIQRTEQEPPLEE